MLEISINNLKLEHPPKKFWEVKELSFEEVAEQITKCFWSPIIWKDNIRLSENYIKADIFALDFDDGQSIKKISSHLKRLNYSFIIGTTKNHLKEKNGKISERFRVVLKFPFHQPSSSVYNYNLKREAKRFKSDLAACDPARAFFPCKEIIEIYNGFRCINIKLPPVIIERQKFIGCKLSDSELNLFVHKKIKEGERNITFFKMALDLLKRGYEKDEIKIFIQQNEAYKNADLENKKGFLNAVDSAQKTLQRNN